MIQPGPCKVCGKTNYPASYGGPEICPACDCGTYNGYVLAGHNAKLTVENAHLRALLGEARDVFTEWLVSSDLDNTKLEALLAKLEEAE